MLLLLPLILYISMHSQISRDIKLRVPFWTLILLMAATSIWMKWDSPFLRLSILAILICGIIFIYSLSFLKRIKTRLDYLKLAWMILFFVDILTLSLMRSLLLKGVNNSLVNSKLTFRVDHSFDLITLVYTMVIAGIIYTHNRKQKTIAHIIKNGPAN